MTPPRWVCCIKPSRVILTVRSAVCTVPDLSCARLEGVNDTCAGSRRLLQPKDLLTRSLSMAFGWARAALSNPPNCGPSCQTRYGSPKIARLHSAADTLGTSRWCHDGPGSVPAGHLARGQPVDGGLVERCHVRAAGKRRAHDSRWTRTALVTADRSRYQPAVITSSSSWSSV
jgi:hypothetical protein